MKILHFKNTIKNTIKALFRAPKLLLGGFRRVLDYGLSAPMYVIGTIVLLSLLPYVQAQFFKDAYVIRTINVFPAAVDAVGWNNIETITYQNLDEYALLQEFNAINAATLNRNDATIFNLEHDTDGGNDVTSDDLPVELPNLTPGAEDQQSDNSVTDVEVEFGSNGEIISIPTFEETVLDTETSTTDAVIEESVSPREAMDAATTTVLRQVESLFALAVETITESVSSDPTSNEETAITTHLQENTTDDSLLSDALSETESDSDVVVVESATVVSASGDLMTEETNDGVDNLLSGEAAEVNHLNESSLSEGLGAAVDNDSSVGVDGDLPTACVENCTAYTATLSDFSYPLDVGVEVSGAQLRLSFAAKLKETRDIIPEFSILYSIDQGVTWLQAGSISIEDEVSNSINGGYYLFALPEVTDQTSLDTLQVQLRYENDPKALEDLFVESIWLELFTLEAPEFEPVDFETLVADNGYDTTILRGDRLTLPDGERINITKTDDNANETLIIKTNESTFNGLSEVTTYFSVTNTTDSADEFTLQTYFPTGVGKVSSLEVFNHNKERSVVIPEYRPYVYHCADGWEYAGKYVPESLDELSRQLAEPATVEPDGAVNNEVDHIEFMAPTSTSDLIPEADEAILDANTTTTVLHTLPGYAELLQLSVIEDHQSSTAEEVVSDVITESVASSTLGNVVVAEPQDDVVSTYTCRNTNVVRECDLLDGGNTACIMEEVLVAEHPITHYAPGWEEVLVGEGQMPVPGLFKRVTTFIGFGPEKKDVPLQFEVRTHTQNSYKIEPGETKYFKMEINFPPFTEGEYWIEAVGNSEYGLLDPFWTSNWDYRIPITIDNTNGTTDLTEYQVFLEISSALTDFWNNVATDGSDIRFAQQVSTGNFSDAGTAQSNWFDFNFGGRVAITIPPLSVTEDHANFPVYVDLSLLDAGFWAGVKNDGGDIRVTTSDGVEVPIDLVEINTSAQTGELHFLAPTIAANAASTFYIYYDNASASGYAASDPLGSRAVWTAAGYQAVYHFGDDPTTVGNILTDETGLGHDLRVTTAAFGTTTGQMGTAYNFTGVSGYLATTTWLFTGGDPLITTGLYKMPVVDNSAIWEWGTGAQPDTIEFRPWYTGAATAATGLHYFGVTAGATYTFARATTTWHAFGTIGTTSTAGNNLVYESGALVETVQQTVGNPTNTNVAGFSVGRQGVNNWWDGQLDELRIATSSRTSERVKLETDNLSDPTHFYTIGDSHVPDNAANLAWYSTSWEQRLHFSIPQARIPADVTDFPVYVDLSMFGSAFFDAVKTDGRDIRITAGDGVTELPIELVSINTGTDTGELYFKADLYRNAPNDFYIYYQNEDAIAYSRSDTYGSNNVWTNNYLAVYHLEEDAAGTSNLNLYKDSTVNAYDGDDYNTSNGKTGLFGKGQEFGDSQDDYLILPREVLNGVTNLTTSWWHQTTVGGSQTIVSGAKDNTAAGTNEYIAYFSATNNFQIYYQNAAEDFGLSDTIGTHNTGSWNFFAVTGEDAIDEVNYFVNGVGDTENPDPQPITTLSIANGGLIVGQEQDSLGGGFQNTQNFEGLLDELRFASVVRSSNWLAIEYANMNDVTSFIATSSAETLAITDFVELDFWVQHFDNTSDVADIWVQVASIPAGEQTTIYLYYGSTGATSASDELATFSYSTSTNLYYVVNDSGATSISVQSHIDGNMVSIGGGAPVALDQGERTTFATFDGDSVISALGPISGTVTNSGNDGGDTIAPISFATTTFAVPLNRSTDRWYIHAPFASTTARTYIGNSGTASQTFNIPQGTATTSTTDPTDSGTAVDGSGVVVEASSPVLLAHRTTNPGDGIVAYPPTTRDLFGVDSQYFHLSATADNPDATVYCSTGSGGATTGTTRGEKDDITQCTTGSEGAGSAVRFAGAVKPVSAVQMADGDGNDATVFWPQHEFGTRYYMTNASAYAAIVCSPRFGDVDLEVQDSSGNLVESATCSPVGNNPGKAYFNNGNGTDGDAVNFLLGHQVVSTNGKPFYMVYEDVSAEQDEKNTLGSVQARKFDGVVNRPVTYGAQESATLITYDDAMEQLSFAWYENTTSQTPTARWPINASEDAEEGIAISGSGAVDDGDILRLRMNVAVSNATATVHSSAFTLQYASASGVGQCSTISDWNDLGEVGSTTATFRGYDIPTLSDGSTLSSTTLALSTVAATYEERNYSDFIPNEIGIGEVAEWDWVIETVSVGANTTYCFRMVRATGHELTVYTTYPELITVGPPNTPTNEVYFDNEHTTDLTPVLEFVAIDLASDDIQYQVQIDDDPTFASVDIDRNSTSHPLNFENVTTPSDKAPFTSGNLIRFTSSTNVASSTTYWWRVRASDPLGSATTSDWSVPTSFTTNQNLATSEWFQTTGAQFGTNSLTNLATTSSAVNVSGSLGTMVGTPVDFDDAVVGNSWAEADWNDTETSGEIRVQVEYKNNGSWQLISDTLIPGNSTGTTTAPINLRELNTDTYNELRLVATFDGTTLSLEDWTIRWGLRVETPVLGDLFDNQKTVDTLPVFDFLSSDPQGDDLEYEVSFSTDKTFTTGVTTYNSSTSAGFANQSSGGDTTPFNSGDTVTYTTQIGTPFTNGVTYWWRARAKDPAGDDSWSPWSDPDSFTVDTGLTVSTWFQTTKGQFEEGELNGTLASTSDSVVVNDEVGEYGKIIVTNGTWTTVTLQSTYTEPVVVASVRYTPTGDTQRTARVRNKSATSFEVLVTNSAGLATGTTTVDYLVVERGDWTIEDGASGKRIIAGTYENVNDVVANTYPASGYGEDVLFSPAFSAAPAVVATISSDNDSTWAVVGLNDGNTRNNAPTASGMGIYLGRGVQTAVHDPEDVDYVVIETGHGTNNGSEFDIDRTGTVHDEPPVTAEAFTSAFSSAPNVVLVQQGAELGGQGGFAGLYAATAPTTNNYYPFIDEDVGADRAHSTEMILAFAFENASGILLRKSGTGLTGTIAGENIIFTDGSGPKYDNFSWNDSTPGASNILYQIQYQVSPGVYALIPNSVIPGNSVGTSTGPIDLTSVDINTYPIIRPLATLSCSGGSCPQINDWQLEWSEGVTMSGTLKEYDRLTSVATGTIMAAVNGNPVAGSATVSAGIWTLTNVTAFVGDIVTVWVDGAAESEEAVAAFVYDGAGDITGVELFEQHLSISANEEGIVTNALLGQYDNFASGDEDIFFDVDGFNNLVVCSVGTCSDATIYIGPGNTYIPVAAGGANVTAHDLINNGTIELDSNTFNLSGSWDNNATSSTDTATINFIAATGTESISSTESPLIFHTLSFGSGAGNATFTLSAGLDLSGSLTVASGTLDRTDLAISLAGNLTTGTGGFWFGSGTTTFDGAGAKTWQDYNVATQKVGDVLIDGASTNVTALTNVGAYDIRIGTNDRLNGTAGKTIYVAGDWENNGTFSAQSGTVEVVFDDRVYPPIVPGSQDWYADSAFDKRIMIGIDPDEVSGNLTSFPVYLDLSTLGTSFWTDVASDGRDIRITSGDGSTELPYDLVSIDATAKTGELHFLADSIDSATTTYFFVYFDNPTASAYYETDPYGSEAVWVDYKAVYHFNDDPRAIDNYITDASSNGNDLLVEVAGLATSTGQLGFGLNLIGSTGILRNAGFTWSSGDPLITSGWYKMPAASNEALWQWGTAASPNSLEFRPWYQTTNGLHYFGVTSGATYSQSPRDTTNWLHFTTIGATSTSQDNLVYLNSIEVERVTQTVANPYNNSATGLQIGREGTTNSLQAQIDELRITTKIRSLAWVEAEYNNQKTPTVFYATSSVQSYTPDLVIDEATHVIDSGGSSFYNLVFNDATTSPAFSEPSVTVTNDLTIATGTVTLPTGVLTIGGSFTNNGYFMHNNAQVTFNGGAAETIALNGTDFYNAFYTVVFNGTGSWTFTDANATTTNNMTITKGTVVFPSGQLTIGGTLSVTGTGVFNANNGTTHFISEDSVSITTRGSSFNNVTFGVNDSSVGWYDVAWGKRMVIKVASTSVEGVVSDFPVYINLSSLGSEFWSAVAVDGADIRMTSSDGRTELPVEVADINVGPETGELYFLAPSLSPTSDTTFYLYFDNAAAIAPEAGSTYGSEAVWAEFEAVYHFVGDPSSGVPDVSGNGKNLSPLVGTPASTAGLIGDALSLVPSTMVGDADWTWTAGEDLVSSGLYYQSAVDDGALWEFGTVCGANNGTCLAFMPWYTGTTGYHRFGVTTADTYAFTRNSSIWHHFTTNGRATAGQANQIFEDSILRGSVLQTAPAQNPTNTGLQLGRYTGGTYMNIKIDELRFATTTRSQQWITTEYNNLTDVARFYSTSSESYLAVVPSYSLSETTTDANGDVTVYYANLVAPSSNFTIGGSALNIGGSYDPNSATTTFDSTDVGETVDFGDGAFYNLAFNGVGGGWTISTTTVLENASLLTGADFVLSPNTTFSVGGVFKNSFNAVATTWSDSILVLTGGDYTVTGRLDSGDDYATVSVMSDSDIVMWNSSISTSTVLDTSSLYMPDFNGSDGVLRIYGAYERTSGTEHWSYATDFDGTALGGSSRAVTVEVGRGSSLYFATGTALSVVGAVGFETAVSAISGIYSLTVNAATLTAENAAFSDMGPSGLHLTNGTTVGALTAVDFGVAGGRSGITVDATTMNAQPSSEFTSVNFATTTATGIYEPDWTGQVVLTIDADVLGGDLTEYPVYVDLSLLGNDFWTGVQSDGRDIRVTTDSGVELPIDLVEINTSLTTGELYFLAPEVSASVDTVFYIHFGNPSAVAYDSDDQFGREAVWVNYEAVYHFNENPITGITDMTGNGRDLYTTSGSPATTTGLIGTALDTTAANNVRLENVGWTWTPGEDLISSGLYFMGAADSSAVWQFGVGNGTNNGTYLSFMPLYTGTTGYHYFGITTGGDYTFTRNNTIWHHFTTIGRATDGAYNEFYEDNILRDSVAQITTSQNPTNTGLRVGAYQTTTYGDLNIDELRFATTTPSTNWIDAEYTNFTDPASFYATSSTETISYNVTTDGVPSTFWLFSGGTGNLYGEDYDNDDGDPGAIQWDDSNFSITISGTVYSDDGVTPATYPVCNGSTEVVTVVLDGVDTYTAACDPLDGSFSVTGVSYTGEPKVVTYINSNATAAQTNVALYDEITGTGTVSGTTMTVSRPNVVDNSVLVLIAGKDDDPLITAPVGWTAINTLGNTTGDQITTGAWYRVVANAGIEAATYNFTADAGEGFSYWMGTLVNVNTGTPLDVASTWSKLQDQFEPTAPSITTVTNGALVLSAWYTYSDNNVVTPIYNWSNRANNVINAETGNLSVSSRSMTTAGATGNVSLSGVIATRETHVAQFAFRPAGSPTASSSIVAATVTKTPLGSTGSPYDTIELRDQKNAYGTVAAAAAISVTKPAVENGDVLVAIIGKEDDFTVTPPAGWTQGDDLIQSVGNAMYTGVWYHVVTNAGSEPASYSFTSNDDSVEEFSYWVGSFSGVDTTNVFDVTPSWTNVQNSSSPAAPGITTATAGAYVLASWYVIDDGAMDMPASPWTTLAQDVVTNNRLLAVAGRTMTSTGATGDSTITNGSTDDVNVGQFALRPAVVSVADSITTMDLYQDRVIVRHEDVDALTIADMIAFDNDNDSDVPFTAATGSPDLLSVESGRGLMVWDSKTFTMGGELLLQGVGASGTDGSLLLGQSSTLNAHASDDITIGGSLYLESGAVFSGASSTVTFTATNAGQSIGSTASSTVTFYGTAFTGVGGGWAVMTPLVSETNILVSTGTVSGIANITLNNGSLSGDGSVDLTGGTVLLKKTNTLGGVRPWTFNNITLGSGSAAGITTPAGTATTSVRGVLTIAAAHFLDANNSVWDLQGSGNVFVESGTFLEDTSVIRYSGATPNIRQTPYYNLVVDTDRGGTVTAVAPTTGLQVLNDVTIGTLGTSTLTANTNDPAFSIGNAVNIGTRGVLEASNSNTLTVNGSWDNNGTFTANGGTVTFSKTGGSATIAAGNSSFAVLNILGTAAYTITENATSTGNLTISTGSFTVSPSSTLAVGGAFSNTMSDANTTWTGTTLSLYSGTAFEINNKSTADTYNSIVLANNTHPRLWNSTTTAVTTNGVSSLYSMDHMGITGDLYIFGDYVNDGYNDHWSYAEDFDGSTLSIPRQAKVYVEANGSVQYPSGALYLIGTSSASTTVAVQTSGTYQFTIGGDTEVEMSHYVLRDTTSAGLTLTGSPNIIDLSNGDFEVEIAEGSTMTVGGSVITANPALNFTNISMATTTAINAYNVTATGTSASAWRFVNVGGNLGGEAKDVDPAGDPGYLTWEDSAAIINISGTVYSDEGSTPMGASVCDGVTKNVWLSMHGLTFASTTCAVGTGAYTFTGIGYGVGNTVTVYINDETENAVTVTQDPVSSISNFDLYQDRVIIKHESSAAMTIADMSTWDSDNDDDILFNTETAGTDTLVLPANTKLIVWDGKKLTPGGNVTVSGGGAGGAHDGTLELRPGATFTAVNGESHTIGGSLLAGSSAIFTPAQSTITFTTSGAARTIDTNGAGFYNLSLTGSGSWTVADTNLTVLGDYTQLAGTITLPNATTTIGSAFNVSGGSFVANGGLLYFTATDAGNTVRFNGSDTATVRFNGTGGSWTMADTNATTTNSFTVSAGTVILPTGTLTVGDDFVVGGNITHSSGVVSLTGTGGGNVVTLNGKTLNDLRITAGAGDYTLTDASAAFLGDLILASGELSVGTGTVSVGGSFDVSGGTFNPSTGTLLFNSADSGEFVDVGNNDLYNVVFGSGTGGWTLVGNATTTNNFFLTSANSFAVSSGTRLYVGGVFSNTVGGNATNWIGSRIVLNSGTEYEVGGKTVASEQYNILEVGANTDISLWNSSATSTVVAASASLYSQDHSGTNGSLYIFGDYHIATTTEYWSYATDFDGVALGGSSRAVSVAIASSSIVSVDGGVLHVLGGAGATTTISNQGSGMYTFVASSGMFDAQYYAFRNVDANGLQLLDTIDIISLDNGDFEQATNSTKLMTVESTALNANASFIIRDTRFANGGYVSGTNVSLDATTTNSWSFRGDLGNLWGEAFDVDGTDDCSSIRWDDSQCLLTEQTTYRWRNDDGGEGAAPGTWYDPNWAARQRVRVINNDASAYSDVAVKFEVAYDTDMQTDFDDIRFTDASGTTTLSYWREEYTTATDAQFWVKIPTMAADSVTEVYMYYDNTSATTTSDISSVFNAYDDFDDNTITEYAGDTTKLGTSGTFAYSGGYGLYATPNPNDKTTDGIGRTDFTISQGEIIRYMQYVDTTAGSADEVCTMFAVQSPVTANQNYAVCLEQFGTDRVSLVKNVQNTDSTGTVLASSTMVFGDGWYEVEIDWQTNDQIDVSIYTDAGTLVATTSATDSTYTSGGFGFTFWGQNGGWDSYVSWPRTDTKPVVYFGAEQYDGGASWAEIQDTPTGGFLFDQTARLRIGIENTGLPIVNQNFRLEFAPKLSAPSCEAVSGGSFTAVPVLASCGSSAVCMTTATTTANGDPTTDHLLTAAGPFVPGEMVMNSSNQTSALDVDQNHYIELEYAIKLTTNATNDAYCFRVTDGGSALDSYAKLPELTLAFDPIMSAISFNNGLNIVLNPGATTTVIASTTVTDYNGTSDFAYATTTFYRSTVTANCTPDNNNCYIATGSACTFTNCVDSTCTLSCSADFQFHADPTDQAGGEFWYAFMEVSDQGGASDFDTSFGIDVQTIRALEVQNAINYGTVDINQNTGTFNPTVSVVNLGNEAIDVEVAGTDMTDGVTSIIPATQQKFATSSFDYSSCTECQTLNVLGTNVEVDLAKPTSDNPPVSDSVYWGIAVPFGIASNPHTGVNTFTAIAD